MSTTPPDPATQPSTEHGTEHGVEHGVDVRALRDAVRHRDHEVAEACRARLASAPGGLGRLTQLAAWVAGAQVQDPPRPLDDVRLVAFAADHGVAVRGVSTAAPGATAARVQDLAAGRGALSALARQHHVPVRVVDLTVDGDLSGLGPDVGRFAVRRGSGPIDVQDALSTDEVAAAFAVGVLVADEAVDSGADLLVPVAVGAAGTTVASALVAVLLGLHPLDVISIPPGADDQLWARTVAVLRDAAYRGRLLRADPLAALAAVGGADLAALTGLLVQAAARRTPVLLDGLVPCAAGLAARRLVEGSQDWWLAGHRTAEPAQHRALDVLGLEPVLDLGLHGGASAGLGALTALAVLRSAVATAEQPTPEQR